MRTTLLLKKISVLFLSAIFISQTYAQGFSLSRDRIEYGFGMGPVFYLGDLGGNPGKGSPFLKDLNMSQSKMIFGIYGNIHPFEWLGVRASINAGKLEGYDKTVSDKGGPERDRRDRNLQFQSGLVEGFIGLEIYPTVFFEKYDGLQGKLRPYGVAGVGLFHFNPKAQYVAPDGSKQWVELQPLKLEGQGMSEYGRKDYQLTQMNIPLGIGAKYFVKENFYVGVEVLHRITFTDYLDDVSRDYIDNTLFSKYLNAEQAAMANQLYYRGNQTPTGALSRPPTGGQRGNPDQNDSYFSTTIRMGWRLKNWDTPNGRASRQSSCPSYF